MSNHGDRHVKPRELRASSMVQGLAHRLVVYPSPVFCSRISLILLGLIRTDVSTDGNCLEPALVRCSLKTLGFTSNYRSQFVHRKLVG